MTRALIVDDERLMRDQLRRRLAAAWPELVIAGEAENGPQAVDLVAALTPDLVFLDIRMPGMSGLEVARAINGMAHVVFITAYDQHAVEAFEHGAVDYLLKPVEEDRLARTVARLQQRLESPPSLDGVLQTLAAAMKLPAAAERLRWIRAQVGTQLRLIPVEDIVFIQADDKYTQIFTRNSEALIRKPIKELVEELDPERFWQIHRSTIVQVAEIAGATRDLRDRLIVTLRDRPEKLEVSRSYTYRFKQM